LQTRILADTPAPGFDVPACLSRTAWQHRNPFSACEFRLELAWPVAPGAIDLSSTICPDHRCAPLTPDGTVIFRDANHLTASYSRKLAPALALALTSRVPVAMNQANR
jgi:hypothetical protein